MYQQTHGTSASARKHQAAVRRVVILAAGAALAFLVAPKRSNAAEPDPCPIKGCGDEVARSCGVCSTINGNYAVYYQ
jgi:hypothetical protein